VVLMTAEDEGRIIPSLSTPEDDSTFRGQPRQNVILEAGLALGIDQARTILVELGPIRRTSDFEGLNTIRMSNAPDRRSALKSRLTTAGCNISHHGADWLDPALAGNFDAAAVQLASPRGSRSVAVVGVERMMPDGTVTPRHLEAWLVRDDSELVHSFWLNDYPERGWSKWSSFGAPPTPVSSIAAVSSAPDSIHLFALASDGVVHVRRWWRDEKRDEPRWERWQALDGHVDGPISVGSLYPGHLELFAWRPDGRPCHRWYSGDSWSQWHGS